MKKIILLIIFLGAGIESFSQMHSYPIGKTSVVTSVQTAPVIQWQNTIGGNGNDYLYSIQQTTDGGYILGGWSASNISGDKTENNRDTICNPQCSGDYWIVKTDSTGNIQWQKTIGGNGDDLLKSIQQTADGGYILGGESESDSSGDKTENSIGVLGYFDYWIVKTDALGNILWQNTIGGNDRDELISIQQTTDGEYILGGLSKSNISGDKTENSMGGYDYWIVKTDAFGNIQWQNTIGGGDNEAFYSIQQTADEGYILGGWSASNISGDKTENCIGYTDYWIVKTDSLGNILWQNTIGGSEDDVLRSLQQTADGGYILGGYSESNISGDKTENNVDSICNPTCLPDYWIVKTDATGNIQWQNTIGGNSIDELNSIQQTADGGYILGGYSRSDISGDKTENTTGPYHFTDSWIIKTDSAGNIQWQNTIGGSNGDWPASIQQTADGEYIIGGTSWSDISGDKTENCMGSGDYWIVKLIPSPPCSTAPASINLSTNDTICSGTTIALAQVGGVLSANGAFHWYTDSCGGTSIGTGYTIIVSPTATTTYYVRAEDSCGVTACASITINVLPAATPPALTGPPYFCQGDSVFIVAQAGYSSYLWSTGATTASAIITAGGTYTVTVSNSYGCTATGSISITTFPLATATIAGNANICIGSSVSITILFTGTPPFVYSYTDGVSVFGPFLTSSTTIVINVSPNVTTVYTLVNPFNDANCYGTVAGSATVTVNPNPSPSITGITTICQGSSTTLNVGSGYTSYLWSNAITTQTTIVSSAGVYTVTVTNAFSCSGSASITVTVNPNPVPVITGNTTICQGNSTTLNAGAGYSSYAWSTGSGTQTINVTIGGIYTVTVTDGNGCTGSASVTVTVHPNPVAVITPAANSAICAGDTVHFMANTGAGYTYQWFHYFTPIAGATNSFYNATANGAYKVQITDSNLCTGFSSSYYVIIVCPPPIDDPQRIAPGSANEIVIVPNPASDEIEVLNLPARTDISIHILSAIGEKVFTKQLSTGNQPLTIDISHFANGVYFITIDDGKEKAVKKFVKE